MNLSNRRSLHHSQFESHHNDLTSKLLRDRSASPLYKRQPTVQKPKKLQHDDKIDRELQQALLLSLEPNDDSIISEENWRSGTDGNVGLKNVQNSCYFNSLIQAFFEIQLAVDLILRFNCPDNLKEVFRNLRIIDPVEKLRKTKSVELVRALQKLFVHMLDGSKNVLNPSEALDCIVDDHGNPINRGEELDLGEFLINFIERIEEGLSLGQQYLPPSTFEKRKRDKAESFSSIFFGNIQENTVFDRAGSQIASSEKVVFGTLNLSVGEKSLLKSLDSYMNYDVEKNDLVGRVIKGKKISKFTKMPKVLTFMLKRVAFDRNRGVVKVSERFDFPKRINLSKHCETTNGSILNANYRLHSMIIHEGDIESGHYYTLAYDTKRRKWMKFNDSRITEITEQAALNLAYGQDSNGDSNNNINQPCAYCLLYVQEAPGVDVDDAVEVREALKKVEHMPIEKLLEESLTLDSTVLLHQPLFSEQDLQKVIADTSRLLQSTTDRRIMTENCRAFMRTLEVTGYVLEYCTQNQWKQVLATVTLLYKENFVQEDVSEFLSFLRGFLTVIFLRVCDEIHELWHRSNFKEALRLIDLLVYCLNESEPLSPKSVYLLQIMNELRQILEATQDKRALIKLRTHVMNIEAKAKVELPQGTIELIEPKLLQRLHYIGFKNLEVLSLQPSDFSQLVDSFTNWKNDLQEWVKLADEIEEKGEIIIRPRKQIPLKKSGCLLWSIIGLAIVAFLLVFWFGVVFLMGNFVDNNNEKKDHEVDILQKRVLQLNKQDFC